LTLIECMSLIPIENIAATLALKPQKLVFLGEQTHLLRTVPRYQAFLSRRGLATQIVTCPVCLEDMGQITQVLKTIISENAECVIDVTGGRSPVMMAVGAVIAGLKPDQKVRVQKIDLRTGAVLDYFSNDRLMTNAAPSLSVEELISLHGGSIHPQSTQLPHCYTPQRIEPLWNMVCQDPRVWNKTIAALNELERRCESKTDIYLELDQIAGSISDFAEKETMVRALLERLHQCGVICDRSNFYALDYSYIDPFLHECAKKAGNMLEIKTLLEARALQQENSPYFCDCQMSVTIDWDGVVHSPAARMPDTRNEVDVIVTRGMIPLFISCKNGTIGEEELYKLGTVASRFGSPYARKMLIATDLEQKSPQANRAFIQRAKDMRVYLVPEAALLSREGWAQALQEAFEV